MKLQNLVALGIAGALLGTPVAHAFKTVTCGGATLKWSGTAQMTRARCSVPDGSTQATSYFSAIDRWNEVRGASDKLDPVFFWPSDHCYISLDDEFNDFALVDTADIDGNLGGTFVRRDCPEIKSIDILLADKNTQGFSNPDESFAVGLGSSSGRFAVLHEFGHGLGLSVKPKDSSVNAHVTGFAVMRRSPPTPLAGGLDQQHARVMPDDAQGLRHIYPNGNTERNLMASAQSLSGETVVNNTSTETVTRCRGESVTFTWTVVNAGTVNATTDQRFFLHASSSGHDQTGVGLGTWIDLTVNANHSYAKSVTRQIPCGTTPGTYFLFHEVDSKDEFDEWNENDNVVRLPLKVMVIGCGC